MRKLNRLFDLVMPGYIHDLPEMMLRYKKDGEWLYYSPEDVSNYSLGVAHYLIQHYVKDFAQDPYAKAKIGLICFSRPNWLVIDFATQMTGGLLVPLYPNITATEIIGIFNETKIEICFVGDMATYQTLMTIKNEIPSLKEVFVFDDPAEGLDWKSILKDLSAEEIDAVRKRSELVQHDDVATIIYTSGTTGLPKGVMLTHKNIIANLENVSADIIPETPLVAGKSLALSFLPLNHILEKTLVYLYMRNSVSVVFAESIDKIADNLKEMKPDVFTSVPRLLEKVYEKILHKGHELSGFKKQIFFWSVKLANQYDNSKEMSFWYKLKLAIADKLVFSKWREALGGNVKLIIVGGAACQPRLINIFGAAKIVILEGYGLTETSPVISVNRYPKEKRIVGTVGLPLRNVEVKLLEDGEIICKGDNVMLGYYNRPEETENVLKDGWFYTGDVGEFINGNFLKITDRKKEFLKTSGGKYVVPQPIENKLKESYLIEQIMLIGNNRKFVSALIVPSFANLEEWCKKNKIEYASPEAAVQNPQIIAHFQDIIDKYNPQFNHVEQIKRFTLLPHEWTVERGELTPSVKTKRKVILQNYDKEIEAMYNM